MTLLSKFLFLLTGLTIALFIPSIRAIFEGSQSKDQHTTQVGDSNSNINPDIDEI